jgi:uncharacterized membrane protein
MWVPILVYTGVFVTLFITHIIAAANDWDILFRVVAALITLQTLFAGFCLHLLKGDVRHARLPVIALSAGLGWAYAGMQMDWSIGIWVLVAIILQILTEKGLKYGTPAESTDG